MSVMSELHAEMAEMLIDTRQMQEVATIMAARAKTVADRHERELADERAMQLYETHRITELLRGAA